MHKIDAFGATVDNQFTDGNPALAVPATTVGAKWFNAVQGELVHLIEEAGIVLDDEDNTQLHAAVAELITSALAGLPTETAAYKAGTVSRDVSLANGDQAITGLGFQPRALFLFGGITGSARISWGISDGTSKFSVHDNHLASANTFGINTNFVTMQGASDLSYVSAVSFGVDGFTLSWVKSGSPTGNATLHYLAWR